MYDKNTSQFCALLKSSIENKTFVKATFGVRNGSDPSLKKILVRLINTKKGTRLMVLFRDDTRDITKNYSVAEGISHLKSLLESKIASGHLFSTDHDHQLTIGKKGNARLNRAKPTFNKVPDPAHDRKKKRFIDPDAGYLKALGITSDSGLVRAGQQNKWKQINKFVEIMASLVKESDFKSDKKIHLLDMGCGKGYLTFAIYDYFTNTLDLDIDVIGVDSNSRLMELAQSVADTCEFEGLKFKTADISDFSASEIDILVALHACDTATDDALFRGIKSKSRIIVSSPCCHKELRAQIQPPEAFGEVLKHGILLERQAEIITDGIRALLLQSEGYTTSVFEFVPTEHTPKNNLITAVKNAGQPEPGRYLSQFNQLKTQFGISSQRLDSLLRPQKNYS